HEAALRSVRRAMTDLQAAGAIRTSERARFGAQRAQNARYRLYLDGPCPEGEVPSPRKWRQAQPPDTQRPVDKQAPPDADRPMASDAERPAGAETIGRSVSSHRTLSVHPQDAERPTKEEEEEEERINDGSVVDGTVEGTRVPARFQVIEDRSAGRHARQAPHRHPGERPIIPHGLPSLADIAPAEDEPVPSHCRHPDCDPPEPFAGETP
ncbi:MAG: hypothetical protein ACRDNZ_09005, partial [Streptosporangiaceae bacterium]